MSQSGIPQTVMAYGKPIIATNLPAFKEVLKDEADSLLFDVGDSSALYNRIRRIYEERNLYNELIDNIRNFEMNNPEYSWNRISQRYIELIE